jgi:hypothetical protein
MKSKQPNLENLIPVAVLALMAVIGFSLFGLKHLAKHHESSAEVYFVHPLFNVGNVLQQVSMSHSFTLTNRASFEMRIIAGRSTCGCTQLLTELSGQTIPPGRAIDIPIRFDSGTSDGHTSAKVEVVLEGDGKRHYAEAKVIATIIPDVSFWPRQMDFGTLAPGEEKQVHLKVVLREPGSIRIQEISSSLTNCMLAASGHLETTRISGSIIAPKTKRSQLVAGTLTVVTSSPRMPVVHIPITARIRPPYEVVPDVIVLSPFDDAIGTSTIRLRSQHPATLDQTWLSHALTGHRETIPMSAVSPDSKVDRRLYTFTVPNALLTKAEFLNFGLMVENETHHHEAVVVSVQIKRLGQID